MNPKRVLTSITAAVALALTAVSIAGAVPGSASVLIRHELRGCHSWSVNGGAFKASQTVTVGVSGTLKVTNTDVMPHKLVQISGPAVKLQSPAMNHMRAVAKVTFPRAGVYVFGTKAGEDYMKGVKTVGEDNVLRLVVTVR
jgi:plastocyanin